MINKFNILFLCILILQTCFAPPVTETKKENQSPPPDSGYGGLEDYMEYHRYLKEVVNALESDPDFRQKLEKADETEIKSGKIADELQFVSHHVRSRLDEIKRVELQRLRELMEKKLKLEGEGNSIDQDPTHQHLDHDNPHTFEIEDLKKLIKKTTQDLAEADKIRREEFKQYELEKEYQKQEKLNHTAGNEREKLEHEFQEMEQKHKKHEKLHQPGHKAQLEEVWEEQDQMQQDFDPKTFFMLHDIDGNGLWDQEEVKALFIKELDKMYQQGAPEDDMRERIEEMERMRESVFNEMDVNKDGFIDYREFLRQTNSNDFKQDQGWQGLDEQTKPYTDEELAEYVRRHHAANQIPQHGYMPVQQQPPAGYPQVPPGGYQQVPPGGYQQPPPNQQFNPGQVPQMAPQSLDLNTNEIYGGQPPQYHQQAVQQPPQYHQQAAQQPPQYHQQAAQQPPQQPPQYHQQAAQQPPQQPLQNHQQAAQQPAQYQQQAAQHQEESQSSTPYYRQFKRPTPYPEIPIEPQARVVAYQGPQAPANPPQHQGNAVPPPHQQQAEPNVGNQQQPNVHQQTK